MILPTRLLPVQLAESDLLGHRTRQRRSGKALVQPLAYTGRHGDQMTAQLGNPGRCPDQPTLLITLADDSGSVAAPGGNDPLSNRYEEARRAFRAVAQACSCGVCLGAVLHFDLVGGVPPTPVRDHGLRTLEAGLRVPRGAIGTSVMAPALQVALDLAISHPEHLSNLVVLSDFELLDAEPGPVLHDLAAFPGQVHAVVLGRELPQGLLDEQILITTVRQGDPPGSLARAVFSSLTAHRPGAHAT